MYRVLEGESHFLRAPARLARAARLPGVRRRRPRADLVGLRRIALLAFSAFTMLVTYAIQRLQHLLPWNPQKLGPVEALSSFNTAASFTTNTNWQGYVGETDDELLSARWPALAWHNFISAAAGIAIAVALARGLTRRGEGTGPSTIGNFWVDLTRATVYVLLPICARLRARLRLAGRDPEPGSPYLEVTTLEGAKQTIALGPVASQEVDQAARARTAAASSTPTPPTRSRTRTRSRTSSAMFLIFAIPAGSTFTFGRMAKDQRQGWAIFGAMAFLFFAGRHDRPTGRRQRGQPDPDRSGTRGAATLGNMEGKEVRFGIAQLGALRRRSRPTPRAARSTPCTTASRRSAASCRSSTSSSARSSSAASARGSTACCLGDPVASSSPG